MRDHELWAFSWQAVAVIAIATAAYLLLLKVYQ